MKDIRNENQRHVYQHADYLGKHSFFRRSYNKKNIECMTFLVVLSLRFNRQCPFNSVFLKRWTPCPVHFNIFRFGIKSRVINVMLKKKTNKFTKHTIFFLSKKLFIIFLRVDQTINNWLPGNGSRTRFSKTLVTANNKRTSHGLGQSTVV